MLLIKRPRSHSSLRSVPPQKLTSAAEPEPFCVTALTHFLSSLPISFFLSPLQGLTGMTGNTDSTGFWFRYLRSSSFYLPPTIIFQRCSPVPGIGILSPLPMLSSNYLLYPWSWGWAGNRGSERKVLKTSMRMSSTF